MGLELSQETTDRILAEAGVVTSKEHNPDDLFTIGAAYLIRTVTHYQVGRVTKVDDELGFVFLESSSWVADTSRWNTALFTGKLEEVEPQPGTIKVSLGSIVDINEWRHALPTKVT